MIDKDSIYYSKERYRIIPQQLGPRWFGMQYLVIDTYENEIVGTHIRLDEASGQRDSLVCASA